MAGVVSRASRFFKNAWDKEPIIVVSFAFGITGIVGMYLSPLTYQQEKEMQNMPNAYNYYDLPRTTDRIYEHMSTDRSKQPVWRTDYKD